ncbi:MAG: phosphoribosylaminoimidazolesuccinocarboxamide synthase [Bryobacterales bacterium]|nr:phosphoribosylaminoimidazolesuccinocarboxamide synthase [Bryobacterales bacterium]
MPEAIFTPATKAQSGHDINVSFEDATQLVPAGYLRQLRELTLTVYNEAAAYAAERGILIADTKFESVDSSMAKLRWPTKCLTRDSSRFWPKAQWRPGGPQPSYDKQYVRDYLETLDWDKTDPAPPLPDAVANKTSEKYMQAYRLLTGVAL